MGFARWHIRCRSVLGYLVNIFIERIADTNHRKHYRCPTFALSPKIVTSLTRSHTHAHIDSITIRESHLAASTPRLVHPRTLRRRRPSLLERPARARLAQLPHKQIDQCGPIITQHSATCVAPRLPCTHHTIYLMVGRDSNRHRVGSQGGVLNLNQRARIRQCQYKEPVWA